jgi:hypothetical protein
MTPGREHAAWPSLSQETNNEEHLCTVGAGGIRTIDTKVIAAMELLSQGE